MKATEIVEKLKEVLLGSESEVQEEVSLSEEVVEEQLKDATEEAVDDVELNEETPAVEEVEEKLDEDVYATKAELAEVKAMVEKMMGDYQSKEEKMEVPKEELSAVEEKVEPIVHTPENESDSKPMFNYGQKRTVNTLDRVMARIANNQ